MFTSYVKITPMREGVRIGRRSFLETVPPETLIFRRAKLNPLTARLITVVGDWLNETPEHGVSYGLETKGNKVIFSNVRCAGSIDYDSFAARVGTFHSRVVRASRLPLAVLEFEIKPPETDHFESVRHALHAKRTPVHHKSTPNSPKTSKQA